MNGEILQKHIVQAEINQKQKKNVIERMHEEALSGESYKETAMALEKVEAVQDFRKKLRDVPFGSFHEMVEEVTNINRLPLSREEKREQVQDIAQTMEQKATQFSPRVADIYVALLSEIKEEEYEPKYDITAKKMAELQRTGDINVLFSPNTSWDIKLNRIETRLIDYLLGARAFDRRDVKYPNF